VVTLSAIFTPDQPPEQILPVAAAAGLAQLWVWEDCFSESGIATATAMLAATSRLTVGIGLLPVPPRNVAPTAMEIATLARLFPGRLTAGIGHGVLDWMGQVGARVESPLTLLREYAAAGATHVAVSAGEKDADLERFVTSLAREVSPLVRSDG
jgi:alkanesulfonate monooxygenase SsuD/methylene tetrahydromethanopterin reductase-like flavin-dependent oxidoreductase (luciferase family)